MKPSTPRSALFPTIFATVALLGACADPSPVAPRGPLASASAPVRLTSSEADAAAFGRLPELGSCQQLQAPEGSKLTFHVYATGVQVYRWNGASWSFVGPIADLYADAGLQGLVGTHFAGPTWKTVSGSTVVGTVADRCPVAGSIPWLTLDAVASGSGVFEQTNLIQRLYTVGGNAPATPGSIVGEEASVPYTAEYFFYRAP